MTIRDATIGGNPMIFTLFPARFRIRDFTGKRERINQVAKHQSVEGKRWGAAELADEADYKLVGN
jgi:hypothetical protein